MGALDGRVALITGAGRGLGREHALLFARQGAKVVVNDLGGDTGGTGADATPAQQVVDEITAAGGEAVVNGDDVADTEGATRMVDQAVEAFGRLDVLVNNAGILRDRMLVNMSADEWDVVVRVHLRGHFLPLAAAARHWRERSKAGEALAASVINTTSTSGLFSNVGQANYGAAKSGIATLTEIAQKELGRYGVRCNAIAPAARTRLTLQTPGVGERMAERAKEAAFDRDDPANVAPFVAYLATEGCPIKGKTFFVYGNRVHLIKPWSFEDVIETTGRWEVEELAEAAAKWGAVEWDQGLPMGD
ncbi:MAG TPA: SDR family oxidoreductase [Acidimicrobiales bacterium]|nr:SDR family oxidoreductase [Acidimicrobiales bacterium]